MLSSKIDRALFYSSPSWDSPIVKITKTPLHVLSSLSVMTKAEQAKPQVTNQDTSTNPEGTNPSGTCKDQGPGTIQPRPRELYIYNDYEIGKHCRCWLLILTPEAWVWPGRWSRDQWTWPAVWDTRCARLRPPETTPGHSVLHYHWSSYNEARLSLVESFRVLLVVLCHKEPACRIRGILVSILPVPVPRWFFIA